MFSRLQYISQGDSGPTSHLRNIREALDAGVSLVQLRLKETSDEQFIETAGKAQELCRSYDARFIVNDNPQVALSCGADGVHLGLNDMDVLEARTIVGSMFIGGTANTFEDVLQRESEQVSYIGLGPFRFTNTKKKLSPLLGLEGYRSILHQMEDRSILVPVYAIGGIELGDIKSLMTTGVYGVAVSGLITQADNKERIVREINSILYNA